MATQSSMRSATRCVEPEKMTAVLVTLKLRYLLPPPMRPSTVAAGGSPTGQPFPVEPNVADPVTKLPPLTIPP